MAPTADCACGAGESVEHFTEYRLEEYPSLYRESSQLFA
jgi:hypothetical protein